MENMSIGTMALPTVGKAVLSFVICLIALNLVMKVVDKLLGKATKIDGTQNG